MYQIKQSSTARPLMFLMVDSTDHVTGKTGLTPTVTLSKNGGAFASPSGAVSEVAHGWYAVAGNATDSSTLGPLALHATGTAADPTDVIYDCVLDLPGVAQTGDSFARVGAPAGASVSADIAAVKAETAAINAKTTSLPSDPADASDIAASFVTVNATLATLTGFVDTEVAAIKAKTDALPSDPADASVVAGLIAALEAKVDIVDTNVDAILVDTGTDIPASLDAVPTALENADALLNRDMSAVTVTNSRSPINALRILRNKVDVPLGTVYAEDDATAAWTFTTTTDAGAEAITVVDPT